MKKLWTYLLSGSFFLLVMEFMFQVQIGGDIAGFLFTPIVQIPFLLFAYLTSDLVGGRIENPGMREFIFYILYGSTGLFIIEWIFCGNSPWGNPQAVQFIMFSYWGGAVVFSRILTYGEGFVKVRRRMTAYFLVFTAVAVSIGFLIPAGERFGWIILMAIVGYGVMNVFYLWYFVKRWRR